ncbi:Acid phosphatase [Sphaceloma murrayae]|uniref:Probable endonuclease LCL3 n=1 Tax=Sphaceloma murrayae TaxID=2082308 RepID=A0A2K1QVH8_9PEZI|nr:Acid phosphatase [Sphaceloma murrayae]
MSLMEAKVKAVLSGDTLILHNVRNPAQERTLSLAFVTAPRLRREGDEQGAFESRDFLRKLVLGKVVRFNVLYNIPAPASRDYGTVQLQSGQQLPDILVGEGWVKLRDDAGKKEDSPQGIELLEKLQNAEQRAKSESKGLWNPSLSRIESIQEVSDPKALVEEYKGQTLEAVVERVLTGDRVICRLFLEPSKHLQTLVLIAGIRAPSTKRVNPADQSEQPAEPYGPEALSFIESRLHQRGVQVKLLGVSPNGQLVGEIRHPVQGSIAEHILREGLARCVDHHSTMLGSDMGKLRQAERQARDARKGLFHSVASNKGSAGEIEASVSRVFSADTLFLRNRAGLDKRVNLSSVRQPKPTDPAQAPFVAEAKEFLRKRLIGKAVKVVIDGKRPATDGYDEREMATVTHGGKNVGLALVENGYASVIRHRMDDTDRSPIYDELLAAEEAAKTEGKGMWNPKPPKKTDYVDYSASLDQAKRQMTLFARQKRVPAIVDFVKSGSRFTLLVPRENAKLTFVISGITCPKSARNPSDQGEPFGQEAHDFANRRCMQRDVEIDVENTDKVGGFIGTMYVNRESFAKALVEEGLAKVHAYSAEKTGNANELFAAEKKAKEARKNLWQDWDPSQDAEEDGEETHTNGTNGLNGDSGPTERRKDYRDVVVTHIDPETARLKLQQVGTGTAALTELMNAFRSFHVSSSAGLDGPPKAGDFVSAKFTADDVWYRARVRRNDRENKTSEVVYVDYGNSETIPWSRLRPLDAGRFGTTKLKPQAVDAVLSFVQFSGNAEYLREATYAIEELTGGKQLVANVDAVEKDGTLFVTLFDPKKSDRPDQSVNAEVVGEGLGMVPRKLKAWERGAGDVLAGLRKREDEAKGERRGMWEYGDLTED